MGHATIEWVYVGVVISLLTWVGVESWNVERIVEHVPAEAETIKVTGQQWFWTFEHQDGKKETGQLHVKQGVPYKFELVSKDVVHDFNVPDYTILMDAVPGRVNVVWNLFDKPGEFHIQCREYCGFGHATMKAKLFVEPQTVEAAESRVRNCCLKCSLNDWTDLNGALSAPLRLAKPSLGMCGARSRSNSNPCRRSISRPASADSPDSNCSRRYRCACSPSRSRARRSRGLRATKSSWRTAAPLLDSALDLPP